MGVPHRATYMSAGLQDLKIVLFAHLEQEDFLLGRVTFEPEGYMQVSHLVTKSLAKAKKQWSCMGKQNVKAAYPKDNLEFKPSSNIFAMSWQSQLSNAHYSSLLMGWKAARG